MPNDSNAPAADTTAQAAQGQAAAGDSQQGQQATPPAESQQQGQQAQANAEGQQGQEQTATGEQAQDKGQQAKADDGKQAAPEQYADFAAPEGVKLDDAVVTGFKDVAKDLGLSQENAQKVIDKLAPVIAQRQTDALSEAVEQARTQWGEQAAADAELTKGTAASTEANFQQNLATAKLAFKTYGTPELEKVLNESGLGNHPEVIRWAYRVGKNLQQDNQHVSGGNPGGAKDARSLYPNSNLAP